MTEPHFAATNDLPPGRYQAEATSLIKSMGPLGTPPETIVVFTLTEPDAKQIKKKNPQTGLGGRKARMWLALEAENPVERKEAETLMLQLLDAVGEDDLDDVLGGLVWIRVARVVMRSDPGRYKSAVVEVEPFRTQNRKFVE